MTDLNAFLHHCYKHDLNDSLPPWNPVFRKDVLSMPWKHNGGAEVQLHSFLTLATKWRRVVNSTPQPLYPQGRIPILWIRGWLVPQQIACLYCGPNRYFAACSIVTIAHSFTHTAQWTNTSNQHTLWSCLYNVLYILCCYANSRRWYEIFLLNLFVLWTISRTVCIFSSHLYWATLYHNYHFIHISESGQRNFLPNR